jgi:anaerobic magnesium-protoporphyrin IX monomethyl ester cyclase
LISKRHLQEGITMKRIIDCFLIGHNQPKYEAYEQSVREMGVHSGAYNDLSKNFIRYNGKYYNAADIFNLFCCYGHDNASSSLKPLRLVESFNAGIAYLGTYLHRRGFTFDYVNSFQDQKEELAEKLEQENILTIGILTTFYVSVLPITEILDFIRKHNKTARIIIGGPFISTKFRTLDAVEFQYLLGSMNADFYVNSSRGEETLVRIIKSLKNQLSIEAVHNIYHKVGDEYKRSPFSKEEQELAENMVDWDLFDNVGHFVNVRTAISCPFSCSFCGFPEHAGKYETAPMEAVEQELNLLNKKETVRSIHFVDDTFNIPGVRFKAILRMMIKNNYRFTWNSFFRCQFADREMVALMKESGCESVLLGIESGSNRILRNMNKKAAVEEYYKGIALFKESGIITLGNFVVGFPGETCDTIRETISFIKESGLDFYRAQMWYCEPITPIWRQRDQYNLNGEHFEWSHRTMNSSTASDFIDEMILTIHHPTRFPQYYFDYDSITQLLHKGLTIIQVHQFLQSFNNGIREKLSNPYRKEVSYDVIRQIKESCIEMGPDDEHETLTVNRDTIDIETETVEFDF